MKVIIAAVLYGLLFSGTELITRWLKLNKEMSRKVVHILAGVSAGLLPLFMNFHEIAVLSLLFIPIMFISKRQNIFSSIHEVKRHTYGEVYFPFAILITALLFPRTYIYMYGLLIMGVSDGLASVIGQRYGRHPYRLLGAHKSYEGSLTFGLTAFGLGIAMMLSLGVTLLPAIILSCLLAIVLSAVEGSLTHGLDNLVLSPLSSGCLLAALKLFSLGKI